MPKSHSAEEEVPSPRASPPPVPGSARPSLRKQLGQTLLWAIACNGLILFIEWYAVSPIGFGGEAALFFSLLLFLPVMALVLAWPVYLTLLPFRKLRSKALRVALCAPIYLLISGFALGYSGTFRQQAFLNLGERSAPLVSAIQEFEQNEGHPPAELQDLVPGYLDEIPSTGMPAYPDYQFATDPDHWDGNPWVLYVHCSSGGINFDKFIYYPNQNYPKEAHGGVLRKLGDWAYVHE